MTSKLQLENDEIKTYSTYYSCGGVEDNGP